jgi:hypothetical protein
MLVHLGILQRAQKQPSKPTRTHRRAMHAYHSSSMRMPRACIQAHRTCVEAYKPADTHKRAQACISVTQARACTCICTSMHPAISQHAYKASKRCMEHTRQRAHASRLCKNISESTQASRHTKECARMHVSPAKTHIGKPKHAPAHGCLWAILECVEASKPRVSTHSPAPPPTIIISVVALILSGDYDDSIPY